MNNKIKLLFSASEIDALLSKINNGNVLTDTELLKLQNLDTSVFATKTDLHTHTNKSVIDGITAEKIASWNSKSTFSGDYNDLANKPTIPAAYNLPVANRNTLGGIKVGAGLSITADGILSATGGGTADSVEWESVIGRPTRLSDFTNDSGFITSVPDEYITETELNAKGYLTEHQDISGLALKSELHSHSNKSVIDTITSSMTTKWNKSIPFEDSYVDNCDNWLTNGYTKTSTSTTNHPSVCTGADKWGVLFYISENATNGTGTQMYFPIDGTYAGRVFTRRIVNRNAGAWNLMSNFDGNYENLTNKPAIPSIDGLATETYVDSAIANASLGGGGSVDTSGFALKSELHEHTNKAVIDTITSSMIAAWNNKSNFSGNYDDLTNKPTIPTVTNDLTTTLKNNYDAAYNHSQEPHFSGDYNDLINKPTIPTAYTHPATHPASMITGLSTVATSGSYADLADTPVIPAAYIHPDTHPATMITGLADVATTGSYTDLSNKPTNVSEFNNDSGYLTEHQDISGKANVSGQVFTGTVEAPVVKATSYFFTPALINEGDLTSYYHRLNLGYRNHDYWEFHEYGGDYRFYKNTAGTDGGKSLIANITSTGSNFTGQLKEGGVRVYSPNNKPTASDLGITIPEAYVLPVANQNTLGGIKVGAGLSITADGILSATGGGTADSVNWENVVGKPTFATVATSGSYNDLADKPTIPTAYTHPATHPASMITGLSTVATSGSYADLTNKPTIPTVTNDLTNKLKANYDAAYTHSTSAHAPSNAQKNSDITKAEIEAKLIGDVTTHTHSQYLTGHQDLTGYATEDYVNSRIANLQIVPITQADYDALETKDPNTLYLITTSNAGSIDSNNHITLSSDLPSGRYTLKYENENGQPLSDFEDITIMEV